MPVSDKMNETTDIFLVPQNLLNSDLLFGDRKRLRFMPEFCRTVGSY